jgi:uncharacterized protein YqjF (DUF2071 family)
MPDFRMDWRDVLFVSYPVDPDTVAPHLPDGLDLDTHDGRAYLSVVPFVIEDVRPAGLPAAIGLTTPELNLRTYVTIDGARGVYFFSLDADDLIGVVGARLWNHLPYYYADVEYDPGRPTRFESRRRTPGARPLRFRGTYEADGSAFEPGSGTVEHFLVERYRYFAEAGDGTVRYAAIDHDPWTLRPASWEITEAPVFAANGFEPPDSDPVVSHSRGVSVEASASRRWDG